MSPRFNFYVPEKDVETYKKAKAYAGESISSVINEKLREFVNDREMAEQGMEEIPLWVGFSTIGLEEAKYVKFIGREIGKAEEKDVQEENCTKKYRLYLTRKHQYLLYEHEFKEAVPSQKAWYTIYKSYSELQEKGSLPPKLLRDAEENLPEKPCEVIDV